MSIWYVCFLFTKPLIIYPKYKTIIEKQLQGHLAVWLAYARY